MAYDIKLADRVRDYLSTSGAGAIKEKEMFRGIAFLVNDKMCVNVSNNNLMCRIDPDLIEKLAERRGFMPMVMRGKVLKGYCLVSPEGFSSPKDFSFWIDQCLAFNPQAKSSKPRKVSPKRKTSAKAQSSTTKKSTSKKTPSKRVARKPVKNVATPVKKKRM